MKILFILISLLIAESAYSDPEIQYEILKEEQTLYDETSVTAKCENGVVISVRCVLGRTQCGVDSKPLNTALERACAKVMPPPTPVRRPK